LADSLFGAPDNHDANATARPLRRFGRREKASKQRIPWLALVSCKSIIAQFVSVV